MFACLRHLLSWVVSVFRSREELLLENLALRQQLLALHAKRPRPRLSSIDRLFWVVLRKFWSGWKRSLILVTPETVVRWHRAGFRLYWSWISLSRHIVGRKSISREVRELIFRMVTENPTWGAPRIHGELLKLGFDISERTVSRWVKRATRNPDPARRWLAFLRNHRDAIVAMDFFTVPTLTFGVLYCFFVIGHNRRKILHCNVTRQPNALWIVLQLREVWVYDQPQRFLVFDRDAKFSADVVSTVKQNDTEPVRTAFRSPRQNGVAERWVGSVRRELLDHCGRSEPAALEKIAERIRPLLPRRQDSSRVREGHARWSGCRLDGFEREQSHLAAATWRAAPPLRSSRLNRPAVNRFQDPTKLEF
jgi:putative transposase